MAEPRRQWGIRSPIRRQGFGTFVARVLVSLVSKPGTPSADKRVDGFQNGAAAL